MVGCRCPATCRCREHPVVGCHCKTIACFALCECREKCVKACRCSSPCRALEADLRSQEKQRDGHVEVLSGNGLMLDADTRTSVHDWLETQAAEAGWADLHMKLFDRNSIFYALWEYLVVRQQSYRQLARMTMFSTQTIHAYVSQLIGSIKVRPDIPSRLKPTIVEYLRSGRQGGRPPKHSLLSGRASLAPPRRSPSSSQSDGEVRTVASRS